MYMPFGKYKNYELTSIPINYLKWCANNFDSESADVSLYNQIIEVLIKDQEDKLKLLGALKTRSRLEVWMRICDRRFSVVFKWNKV